MAISRIGIYPNKTGAIVGDALEIFPSDSAPALKFRFATQSNTWLTANIWVTVDIVRKAGDEAINGYARIGADGATGIARTAFSTPTADGGEYVYEIALSNAALSAVATLLGTLTYSGRSYDAIRLTVDVRVVWGAGANEYTRGSQVCYIGFKPTYTATGAHYAPDGLSIAYTASGWGRPNDRWANGALTSGSDPLAEPNAAWGTADGGGVLVIPADKLLKIPATGETLGGSIRMVGSWQGVGATLGEIDLTGVSVTNLTQVRKPTITATAQNGGVLVAVTAGTGTGTAATRIEVSLEGSAYAMDRAVLAPGDSHFFAGVPAGVATTWQAVGIATVGGHEYASGPTNATAQAVSIEGFEIVPQDGDPVPIAYNATITGKTEPESETVKLAGRERPTVGFGEGGTGSWTIDGTIIADAGLANGKITTDPDAVAALPFAGLCLLRDSDGWRAQVYVESASVRRAHNGGRGTYSVTISAEEVS